MAALSRSGLGRSRRVHGRPRPHRRPLPGDLRAGRIARCRPHAVLSFHDFWNRTPYHPVPAFTDWLGSCDSLAILRRKRLFDQAKSEAVRQAYRLQPD